MMKLRRRCLCWICCCAVVLGSAKTAWASENYEFNIPWDGVPADVVNVGSLILDPPAGKHGQVVAKGDKLYFENGLPARFWGIGIALSARIPPEFPPDKETAKSVIRKLAGFGFNHVRFVGFDNTATEVFRSWRKTGKLDSLTMDRFDYFVSELRKSGIYYSLSINNSAVAILDPVDGVLKNDAARTPLWRYKHVRMIDEKAVNAITAWYRAFFSHVNPYTGLSYAADPANVYVSAANEDSIFEPYFNNFSHFSAASVALLEKKFNEYLAKRYESEDMLRSAWRERGKPGLRDNEHPGAGTVALVEYKKLARYSSNRVRDTMRFLVDVDFRYADRIRETLEETGYHGLFSATNNWYGYGSLYANHLTGNYIDLHGYLDHPRHRKWPVQSESISNRSYLAQSFSGEDPKAYSLLKDFAFPLGRTFISSPLDRPLVISEWNHAAWSDFAYEGPVLLTAYAAFQGYPILNIHTYFNHPDPDPREEHVKYGLTASGNPVLMALAPSLSLAFVKGYIKEPEKFVLIKHGRNEDDFLDFIAQNGMAKSNGSPRYPVSLGLTHKIRKVLHGQGDSAAGVGIVRDEIASTVTGEIVWNRADAAHPVFQINTPKFKAFAGNVNNKTITLGNVAITPNDHGAITIVSLDDLPLADSKNILVTAAQSFKNSGMKWVDSRNSRTVLSPGFAPALMNYVRGRLVLNTSHRHPPKIQGILPDGNTVNFEDVAFLKGKNGTGRLEIKLGTIPTPWYWIQFAQAD